jgi:uncharacterized protein YdeI (YjbR/CyaY-like superfamily)
MGTTALPSGTIHRMPPDLRQALKRDAKARETWLDITPLARNEWICLVTSAKTQVGRDRRLERARDQLSLGHRRPCCWEGCPHRAKTGK